MNKSLWSDRKTVRLILSKNGMYLKNVNKLLKNDLKLVLTAVKQNSRASIFMDPSLWSNKTIVMQVLRGNGLSLESASNKLKNDYDIVLTAVKKMVWL